MTPQQIELARHALGLPNKARRSYRNHFVVGPGHEDYDEWLAMVTLGCAMRRNGSAISGWDDFFYLTADGATRALKLGEKLCAEDFPSSPDSHT